MVGGRMSEEKRRTEDVEELRGILGAVSEFLEGLPPVLDKILSSVTSREMGDRLGESVGAFYKKLKDSGIPEDQAREMAREFFSRSMILDKIISTALKSKGPWAKRETEREPEEED